MTCHAYMLTGVGLDLMHLLGWVSIHDTHHHMRFLRKNFVVVIFGVWIFWVVTAPKAVLPVFVDLCHHLWRKHQTAHVVRWHCKKYRVDKNKSTLIREHFVDAI